MAGRSGLLPVNDIVAAHRSTEPGLQMPGRVNAAAVRDCFLHPTGLPPTKHASAPELAARMRPARAAQPPYSEFDRADTAAACPPADLPRARLAAMAMSPNQDAFAAHRAEFRKHRGGLGLTSASGQQLSPRLKCGESSAVELRGRYFRAAGSIEAINLMK